MKIELLIYKINKNKFVNQMGYLFQCIFSSLTMGQTLKLCSGMSSLNVKLKITQPE